jgi:hypothetical protein
VASPPIGSVLQSVAEGVEWRSVGIRKEAALQSVEHQDRDKHSMQTLEECSLSLALGKRQAASSRLPQAQDKLPGWEPPLPGQEM